MSEIFDIIVKMTPSFEKLSVFTFTVKDLDGKYLYISPTLLDFFGKTTSDLLYKKSEDIWPPHSDRYDMLAVDEELIIHGKSVLTSRVLPCRDSSDRQKFLRVLKTPVYDSADENIIGVLGIGFDVSANINAIMLLLQIVFRNLSKTEKMYFFFKSQGFTRAEIAKGMNASLATVDSCRSRIIKKFGVNPDELLVLEKLYTIFVDQKYDLIY